MPGRSRQAGEGVRGTESTGHKLTRERFGGELAADTPHRLIRQGAEYKSLLLSVMSEFESVSLLSAVHSLRTLRSKVVSTQRRRGSAEELSILDTTVLSVKTVVRNGVPYDKVSRILTMPLSSHSRFLSSCP